MLFFWTSYLILIHLACCVPLTGDTAEQNASPEIIQLRAYQEVCPAPPQYQSTAMTEQAPPVYTSFSTLTDETTLIPPTSTQISISIPSKPPTYTTLPVEPSPPEYTQPPIYTQGPDAPSESVSSSRSRRTSFGGAGGEFSTFTPYSSKTSTSSKRTSFGGAGGDFTTFTPSGGGFDLPTAVPRVGVPFGR